jgi:hypothetical protein
MSGEHHAGELGEYGSFGRDASHWRHGVAVGSCGRN